MKKTAILFLALVIIVSAFCGCTNRKNEIMPSVSPIVTTTPTGEIIPDEDVVPDVEDGIVTDKDTENGVIRDDKIEDGVETDGKSEKLPADIDKK
ncbi:MAG: hypothetical protein GX025_04665 [Clostridiales bacterium]|nr:hypothetical protein [Clostridiales bacterium]